MRRSISGRRRIDLEVLGTVKDTLSDLLHMIREKTDSAFLDSALEDYQKTR